MEKVSAGRPFKKPHPDKESLLDDVSGVFDLDAPPHALGSGALAFMDLQSAFRLFSLALRNFNGVMNPDSADVRLSVYPLDVPFDLRGKLVRVTRDSARLQRASKVARHS